MRKRTLFLSLAADLAIGVSLPLAQAGTVADHRYVTNFVDVEITTLAEAVATATGKPMVLHPQVLGLVTLVSREPMTATQMFEAFAQVVVVQGYVLEETQDVVKIYPGKPKD